MTPAARSIFVFSWYLVAVGAGLVVVPQLVLRVLGFAPAMDFWPRVVGVLALALAWYYFNSARREQTDFFRWTVQVRVGVFVVFGGFVVLRFAPPALALVGLVDLAAAIWTAVALRSAAGGKPAAPSRSAG